MIFNFLTVTLRKMARNKISTVVNVIGLALGISGTMVIATLLRFESGYNMSYPKVDRLYRVVTDEYTGGEINRAGASVGLMEETLEENFPEVEGATLAFLDISGQFTIRDDGGERKFHEDDGVARVAPEYFGMFDIPWTRGDPRSLAAPNTVALTRSIARKYFGDTDPMGKTVLLNNATELTVVGVLPDPPATTDIGFTVYLSRAGLRESDPWIYMWTNLSSNVQTFVLLREGADAEDIETRLRPITGKFYTQTPGVKVARLQPLSAMHYDTEYADTFRAVGRGTLAGLGLIGIFLLLTSCVNFVNMATAQAAGRSREVGVRKVLGAVPRNIAAQFLWETFLIVTVAAGISIVIAEIVTPLLAERLDIPLTFLPGDPLSLLFMCALVVLTTGIAGVYPALMLAGFGPAAALKGRVASGGLGLRRGLVIFQFAISQLLIIGTLVVTLQMRYVINKDMGFIGDGIVMTALPDSDPVRLDRFRNTLLSDPQVLGVSFSYTATISDNTWDTNLKYEERGVQKTIRTDLKFADPDYFTTYGLTLVAGRAPLPADTLREFVVNEAFTRKLGLGDPGGAIGRTFRFGRRAPMPVVGVVRDFNTESLRSEIDPCLIAPRTSVYREAGIRIRQTDVSATIARIEKAWNASFPEYIFESQFLDERIERLYLQERRVEFLFHVFAATAIGIGCIGLFGLVSFVAARKTKEIGVRKVLGATVGNIVGMFTREFALLIVIAFAVAAPVGYFTMQAWLDDFAYRIPIGPMVFVVALATIVVITGMTIGYRALRAAGANPVESLRYE